MNAIWKSEGSRRALITGASGGIGEAFAAVLAKEGWELTLVARSEEQLNRVAGVLRAKHHVEVHPLPMDLTHRDSGQRLATALDRRDFSPDVLINNAGYGLSGEAAELPLEEQLAMIDLNARAATDLALRFLPGMIERGAGGVLNVSSLAGFMPGPFMAVYFATKSYLLSFSQALAEEVAGSGVTVSSFCPGPVRTAFQDRSGMGRTLMVKLMRPAPPERIAQAGWEGFKEGKRVIIPGALNNIMAFASQLPPKALSRRVTRVLLAPRKKKGKSNAST